MSFLREWIIGVMFQELLADGSVTINLGLSPKPNGPCPPLVVSFKEVSSIT